MISLCVDGEQLRRALANIERAEKNGFMYCLAVFYLDVPGVSSISDMKLSYSAMIERAHPTDGKLNWGRDQGVTENYKFRNGKLVPIKRGGK